MGSFSLLVRYALSQPENLLIMDELEQIQQQIAELQKKAEELAIQKKQPVIDEIKAKLKAYGITAKDLGFSEKVGSKPVSTVAIKYRQGEKTWTGRGRQPKFIVDHVKQGGKLEDLLV